ncbi:hypothetical protein GLOIN_2v1848141 [Rhizophagus irregularis DAOM 181602=DAOM 197198]|nr:hypothetical protein GLOIN_2v1848141 [Rhizophagus irregularis DAOM 181602=DAOM 197198]
MVACFCSMYYIFMIIFFILFINSNYLLKLQRLLHDRIDPTVEKLRKKPRILKIKRVQRCKTTTSMPPVDTPNWCLTDEALKRFNRSTNEIPTYDYNTDQDEESDEYHNDEYKNKKIKNKKNKKSKKRGLFVISEKIKKN